MKVDLRCNIINNSNNLQAATSTSNTKCARVAFECFKGREIAIYREGVDPKPLFKSLRFSEVTLYVNGSETTVWINKKSLTKRFGVSNVNEALKYISKVQRLVDKELDRANQIILERPHFPEDESRRSTKNLSEESSKFEPPLPVQLSPEAARLDEDEDYCFLPSNETRERPILMSPAGTFILRTKHKKHKDKVLGQGAFKTAKIAECMHTGKEAVVLIVKRGKKDSDDRWREKCNEIENEIALMAQFQGPYFVQLLATYKREDAGKQKYYIVVEKCKDLSAECHSGRLDSKKDAISREMISAVVALHKEGYLHRDIKLNNMLITEDGHVKLSDLGSACKMDDTCSLLEYKSTYPAPEQAQHYDPKRQMITSAEHTTSKADSWALGCALFTLHHPIPKTKIIEASSWQETVKLTKDITDNKIAPRIKEIPDSKYRKIIRALLQVDPHKRIYASTALLMLNSPFSIQKM